MNVLMPCIVEDLRKEIGDSYYSIIVDESTDVGTIKLMAYCIRYYNKQLKKIVTDFLGLQIVVRATAEQLLENFEKFTSEFGLNLKKMIAIATDGANNLCGVEKSLFVLLKAKYPKLLLFKCICHSVSKCLQKACGELPSNLEYLLHETRSWFNHSALRKHAYKILYKSLMGDKEPPKLTTLANTRWLSFGQATKQNIEQWDALKRHFAQVVEEAKKDSSKKCYTARELCSMYEDNLNYLYLLFLNPILQEANKVNLVFQSDKIDLLHAYTIFISW